MRTPTPALGSEQGMTLIETVIAVGILLVVMVGLLSMAALATTYTENHGHLEARTTEYAQDKMEQLLSLAYGDGLTDTVVFPAGIGGTGLAPGGGLDTAAPVDKYVDWLANDGTLLGGGTAQPPTWFYERVWKIEIPLVGIKRIAVTTTVRSSLGRAMIPRATVVALKTEQF